MPIYGGKRDISLFRRLNRELIHRIITSVVDVYKPSLSDTDANIYGEAPDKVWLPPVRIACLIDYPETEMTYNDAGIMDVKQSPIFHFLLDDVKRTDVVIEVGDIISWDNLYWTVDRTDASRKFLSKSPNTQKEMLNQYEPAEWGWQISMSCYTFMTRKNRLSFEKTRSGGNTKTRR